MEPLSYIKNFCKGTGHSWLSPLAGYEHSLSLEGITDFLICPHLSFGVTLWSIYNGLQRCVWATPSVSALLATCSSFLGFFLALLRIWLHPRGLPYFLVIPLERPGVCRSTARSTYETHQPFSCLFSYTQPLYMVVVTRSSSLYLLAKGSVTTGQTVRGQKRWCSHTGCQRALGLALELRSPLLVLWWPALPCGAWLLCCGPLSLQRIEVCYLPSLHYRQETKT